MKDDDSSKIVRSQTAHHVDVSEYTGNATTPQNRVTSDVDRVLEISDADAGPARQIATPDEHNAHDSAAAPPNTLALHHDLPTADEHAHIDADALTPSSDGIAIPVEHFQDELAAIERARHTDSPVTVVKDRLPQDHQVVFNEAHDTGFDPHWVDDPSATETVRTLSASPGEASPLAQEHFLAEPIEPATSTHPPSLHAPVDTAHVEVVPIDPVPQVHTPGEAKPVFTDHRAGLPPDDASLAEAHLDAPALGHPHPLADIEPDVGPEHAAVRHPHPPQHGSVAAGPAQAESSKDEFQGRLEGIKREVQALNERLTDFEAELDKDGIRPTRP